MSLNPGICFEFDAGGGETDQILPTQMGTWPDTTGQGGTFGDQYNNIANVGTDLFKPLKEGFNEYTWNLTNGSIIRVSKDSQDPNYWYYELSGNGQTISGGVSGRDQLFITYNPFNQSITDNTQFGLLFHSSSGYTLTTYAIPLGQQIFEGSESELVDDTDTMPEGGFPDLDTNSDEVPFPPLPTINFLDTGFISMYMPTQTQLRSFNDWLWTSNFIDNFKKIFENPMDSVIGLSILPVTATTSPSNIRIGSLDSGVASSKVLQQYYYIDFGKIAVGTFNSTFYDFAPYTKAEIYLPYIGTRALDIDEIMESTLWLQYMVDVLTGSVSAMLHVRRTKGSENVNGVLYTWNGNMGVQGPVSGKDYTQFIKTFISGVSSTAMSATAGFAAGGPSGAAMGAGMAVIGNTTNAAKTPSPIMHSGNISANTGIECVNFPYIIFSRPIVAIPSSIRHDEGLYSNISGKIGSVSGFVKVKAVHVEGLPATNDEKAELEQILKAGIIV